MKASAVKCDVVIVGSGFGATVAATALAEMSAKLNIRVLERGVNWESGEVANLSASGVVQQFAEPDNWTGLPAFLSLMKKGSGSNVTKSLQPLYHYSAFKDVHVVTASGVGGGSLIYSNVSLPPFKDPNTGRYPVIDAWPIRLQDADFKAAADWMEKWRGPTSKIVTSVPLPPELIPYVDDLSQVPGTSGGDYQYLYLGRSDALRRGSTKLSLPAPLKMVEPWKPVPLQVLEHIVGKPDEYRERRFCERQGRCILGCVPGSMNTLAMSLAKLLKMYRNVVIEPLTNVRSVSTGTKDYRVECQNLISGQKTAFDAPIVVLSAGTLGTNEILLRSSREGLAVSEQLGRGFSTNGDFSAFIDDVPFSFLNKWVMPTKGPINSCSTRFAGSSTWMTVEDAGIPKMFARLVRIVLNGVKGSASAANRAAVAELQAAVLAEDTGHVMRLLTGDDLFSESDDEVLKNVFWFNCMGNDSVAGQFTLNGDKLDLTYPGLKPADDPIYVAIETVLRAFAKAVGGTFVPFPMWEGLARHKLAVTHPLGGCRIGRSSSEGVVDEHGRVFDSRVGGSSVYDGLYVVDGSVLPGPVGANPTLTIVAVALRMAQSLTARASKSPRDTRN